MINEKTNSLIKLADEDLTSAKALIDKSLGRPAVYHLAQAAEKGARAVCEHDGINVGTTHNLGQIAALLPPAHPMREIIEDQDYHSPASTRYRYPAPSGRLPQAPDKEEIQRRIADVTAFLDEVIKYIRSPRPTEKNNISNTRT